MNDVREDVTGHPLARQWVMYAVPGQENTFSGIEMPPVEGFLFSINVGKDCEWLTLRLCLHPETVTHRGVKAPTKLGGGWRFAGFSKTQYASLHGWKHFLRCHRAMVESLAEWRSPGVRVRISDEGEYWPRRSVANLQAQPEQHERAGGGDGGDARVESPIFAHKDFERLEAAGEARGAISGQLGKLKK